MCYSSGFCSSLTKLNSYGTLLFRFAFLFSLHPFYICHLPSFIHPPFFNLFLFISKFQPKITPDFLSILISVLVLIHCFLTLPLFVTTLSTLSYLSIRPSSNFLLNFHSSVLPFLHLLSSISYHIPSFQSSIFRVFPFNPPFLICPFFSTHSLPQSPSSQSSLLPSFILQFSIFQDFHQPLLTFRHEF